jgi:hypothetical protein
VPDLLADVVRLTAAAPSSDVALDRAARRLLSVADWVIADRLDEPDLVTRVAAYGSDGLLTLPEGPAARRSAAGSVGLLPALLQASRRMLLLESDALKELSRSADSHQARQASTALRLGANQVLLLGLVSRDVLHGVLSLGRTGTFTDEDLVELADVAVLLGLALDAARLLTEQSAVATAMQTSLLPPVPAVAGIRLAARYSPAASGLEVGGDWYDAFPTQAGLVVVIGDASGHDVAAAARMADLRNLLRAYAVDRNETPAGLVGRLDRSAAVLGLDATATCLVGRLRELDGGRWSLTWTSAGHLPPVLLHGGRARLLDTAPDLMLGVEPSTARTDHQVELSPGDVLVLYSDGLVEVRGISLEERLEVLRGRVEDCGGDGPDLLAERLLTGLSATSADDIALLVLEVADAP